MNGSVERMLYLTLLLVFIGLGIAIYIAVSFGHRLDEQGRQGREQIIATQQAQGKILNDIQRQHDKQDAELRCIATLFTTHKQIAAVDFNTCAVQSANQEPSPAQIKASQTQSSTSAPKSIQAKSTQTSPTPAPKPINNILNTLQKLLGLTA